MRKITLAAISNLLRGAQYIPLLPHQSVQVPVSKLVKKILEQKMKEIENTDKEPVFTEEFIALLETLSLKIQEIPSCIHFFFHEKEECFPLFDCLVLHINKPGTLGERSRQATERLVDTAARNNASEILKYILASDFVNRVVCFF